MTFTIWLIRHGALLLGLAGVTFAISGLAFFGYNLSIARDRVTRRVTALARTQPSRSEPEAPQEPRSERLLRLPVGELPQGAELELARRLVKLRLSPDRSATAYFLLRFAASLVGAATTALLVYHYSAFPSPLRLTAAAFIGGGSGWFLPQMVLSRMRVRRSLSIERGLPDAIELLVIAVEAGLALEDAIDRIVSELQRSQPAVAEELALTSADLKVLPSRDAALHRLAERVELPSIRSVVTTLSQTMRYGTPLAQALRVVAAELRNDALINLEARVNRMPVLMTVPMILFILPSIFMVIGGPAFLRLMDMFRH